MVNIVTADLVKVIVFAGYAQHFLGINRTRIRSLVGAQEDILELNHTGIREEQGGIPSWDQ